jgi:hypothetical protein
MTVDHFMDMVMMLLVLLNIYGESGSPCGIVFAHLMKNKSETTAVLQRFINDCLKLGIKIARIQSDRGTEYFEQEGIGKLYEDRAHSALRTLCNKNDIDHTVTPVCDKEKFAERVGIMNSRMHYWPQFWRVMHLGTLSISIIEHRFKLVMRGSSHLIIITLE